jgi:hypothetical protein
VCVWKYVGVGYVFSLSLSLSLCVCVCVFVFVCMSSVPLDAMRMQTFFLQKLDVLIDVLDIDVIYVLKRDIDHQRTASTQYRA